MDGTNVPSADPLKDRSEIDAPPSPNRSAALRAVHRQECRCHFQAKQVSANVELASFKTVT
jgi:hypothetical protein